MKKTIDYKYGKISYLDSDLYIGKALEAYGEREDIEVRFICSLVKAGDTVVDVGANIGAITIPVAQKVGAHGRVFAFEPQPEMFELLEENIRQNDLDTAYASDTALGESVHRAGLPKVDYNKPNNFGGCALVPGDDVSVGTLDSANLSKCDLIKVDVEGMEAQVLRGAANTIKRHRPLLYVENDRYQQSAELITLIKTFNYEIYWFTPPLFNPDNFKKNKQDLFPGVVACNMICVPAEKSIEQTKGLRRISSPYDRETGVAQLPPNVRPPNGWAAVARFGGIGDNLMACSAIGALKRKGFKVEVITSTDCAWQVFQHNPNIDKLSLKTKREMPKFGLEWQQWFRGRADEYDVFAHLSHSCEGQLAFFPASTQFHWPAHVRRRIANKNYLEMVHDIAGCGYDFGPLFYASDVERAQALETKGRVGERCIVMAMSGSRHDKLHPILPGIVARLISELGVPVVLLGAPERNYEDAKRIESFVLNTNGTTRGLHVAISTTPDVNGNRVIDWPIRRSLAFAQVADLVIGPDTGIMWAVAFENVPKIMLLGHASPENITKHWLNTVTLTANTARVPCHPCHQLHDTMEFCTPNKENSGTACISDISVETIIQEARDLLAGVGSYGVKQNLELTPHGSAANDRRRNEVTVLDRRVQDNSAA